MSDNHPQALETVRQWLADVQQISLNETETARAAQLAMLNRRVLTSLYVCAIQTAPGGTLFDVTPGQFDRCLNSDGSPRIARSQ